MKDEWNDGAKEFIDLIDKIETARRELHCSISNAWFRGQTQSTWDLNPSLFRIQDKIESDRKKKLKLNRHEDEHLQCQWQKEKDHISSLRFRSNETYKQIKSPDGNLKSAIEIAQANLINIKNARDRVNLKIKVLESVHYGEKEAFIDWCRKINKKYDSSWEVLVEMQHYGVPTRLLDWTENLSVALFFALEKYYRELEKYWDSNVSKSPLKFHLPENLPTPCLWILNPFLLSRKTIRENSIIDPTINSGADYFSSFFEDFDWPFEKPVPIYSPWNNARIESQRGLFTVHGLDKKPLNLQVGEDILRKIEISPKAAVYTAKHLMTFYGMDDFYIYRDQDRLGNQIKNKFLVPFKGIK